MAQDGGLDADRRQQGPGDKAGAQWSRVAVVAALVRASRYLACLAEGRLKERTTALRIAPPLCRRRAPQMVAGPRAETSPCRDTSSRPLVGAAGS